MDENFAMGYAMGQDNGNNNNGNGLFGGDGGWLGILLLIALLGGGNIYLVLGGSQLALGLIGLPLGSGELLFNLRSLGGEFLQFSGIGHAVLVLQHGGEGKGEAFHGSVGAKGSTGGDAGGDGGTAVAGTASAERHGLCDVQPSGVPAAAEKEKSKIHVRCRVPCGSAW